MSIFTETIQTIQEQQEFYVECHDDFSPAEWEREIGRLTMAHIAILRRDFGMSFQEARSEAFRVRDEIQSQFISSTPVEIVSDDEELSTDENHFHCQPEPEFTHEPEILTINTTATTVIYFLAPQPELDTSSARDFDFDTDELLEWEEEFSQPDPGVYTIEERQEQYQTILDYLRHYRELLRAMRRRFQSFLEYLVWLVMNFYRDQRHCYL